MKKIRWIFQNNLISENDRNQFQIACNKLGISCHEVMVIPFSPELPDFPIDDEFENVYYGATTFMNGIYEKFRPIGLFYNHVTFSMENYLSKWGEHMLNFGARIKTVEEFIGEDNNSEENCFIRPDSDEKEFDGQVIKFKDAKSLFVRAMAYETNLKYDSKILVGPAYNIRKEWRNFIVNGKVVTSSRYRENFKLSKSAEDIPADMIEFVEKMCRIYQPHDVFAMDIAEVKDENSQSTYYIIECGSMNSVGFYSADIEAYVRSVSDYVTSKVRQLS